VTTGGTALFLFCALVALLSAVGTITVKSPIRAAMCLLAHIVALSGLFLTLHAHLLAVLQVLVYAGAVVVLFVFVIMLIGPAVIDPPTTRGLVSRTAAAALMGLIAFALLSVVVDLAPERPFIALCDPAGSAECEQFGGVAAFSKELFTAGVLPFELIGILLTVAIVGAIAVARGRSADEAAAAQQRRVEEEAKRAAQSERERELAAEVAASGGH
jgi:NADH-quinone oxidoreductase subunit J